MRDYLIEEWSIAGLTFRIEGVPKTDKTQVRVKGENVDRWLPATHTTLSAARCEVLKYLQEHM